MEIGDFGQDECVEEGIKPTNNTDRGWQCRLVLSVELQHLFHRNNENIDRGSIDDLFRMGDELMPKIMVMATQQ
ncbi:hypothetical protein VCR1J2_20273 [Vibrio coralliirubri]|nr:hypothetical protein VCR1J2_20273 [Vibrio coralliirubri]CDT84814.1 hypothetical protein VCR8J2_240276 [Vibrio coralliirubri]